MSLRPYQEEAIEKARQKIREGARRVVLKLPTGGGKTHIASTMTKSASERGKRISFVCDRIELLDQASARFDAEGIDHGVIQGNHWRWKPEAFVQVCTIQTLVNRQHTRPDLVFIDECHVGNERIKKYIDEFNPIAIGLSATPFAKGMGKVWDALVSVTTTQGLIDMGFLVPPVVWAPSAPDLTGVKVVAGEWQEDQLAAACDTPKLVGDIVATWLDKAENRQTIIFAVNCAHSEHIVREFKAAGVDIEHIDAHTSPHDRYDIVSRFRKGDLRVISNVGILDKGFDVPEAGCIVYARPIRSSLSLYIQMGGRGLRAAPGKKDCIILDHAGNTMRHGFLTDPTPDELDDGKKKPKKKQEPPERLPKVCPSCHFVKAPGQRRCPRCGFEPQRPNEVFSEAGELVMITKTPEKRKLFAEIKHEQRRLGRSDGWAAHTFKKLTGVWPNHYKDVAPEPAGDYVRGQIKRFDIAFAKSKSPRRSPGGYIHA